MRRSIGFIVAVVFAGGCSSDPGAVDVGMDSADIADEAPYGVGAEVGVSYDYAPYVHCGVEWARIDGVWWRTKPLDDGTANPPEGWGDPYHRGSLKIEEGGTADFEGPDGAIEFERTDIVDVPHECE